MKLKTYAAPHIRHQESTRTLMLDVMISMVFIYAMAFYYYGPRVVVLLLCSVAAAWSCDILCTLMVRKRPNLRDLSPVVTGMLLPLLLPATVEYKVVVVAAVFAMVVAKHPFGGTGHNVFNPAAAGFSFVAICFTDKLFAYPAPLQQLPVLGNLSEVILGNSPAFTLSIGGVPKYDLLEMALGSFPGPMGATNILVILACLLYLIFRGTIRWEMPLCFFVTVAAFAWLFPRVSGNLLVGWEMRLQLVLMEMMSGVLLLGGIFLLGDPVTTPKRSGARAAFAVVTGVAVMLFRRSGGFEEAFTFAILLMNGAVWAFDMLGERIVSLLRRRRAA